jgi:hypothetical protein
VLTKRRVEPLQVLSQLGHINSAELSGSAHELFHRIAKHRLRTATIPASKVMRSHGRLDQSLDQPFGFTASFTPQTFPLFVSFEETLTVEKINPDFELPAKLFA